jgi:hypothetical protein
MGERGAEARLSSHRNDLIEIFAGRVYGEPSEGLRSFRELLANPLPSYETPGEMRAMQR